MTNEDIRQVINITKNSTGINLFILRLKNDNKEKVPCCILGKIIDVIRNPDITKNTSTPIKPPERKLKPA